MKYFILAFKNWNKFNGRANRAEYWYFVLFSFLIGIIFNIIDFTLLGYDPMDTTSIGILSGIFNLFCIVPSLSVTVRRLHDVNKSGWNMFWALTIIGAFYVLYLEIIKGSEGDNDYGAPSNA